jgi:hypothetical protein
VITVKDLSEYYLHCENGKELFEKDTIDVYYGYWTHKQAKDEELFEGIEPVNLVLCADDEATNPYASMLSSLVLC